MITTREQLLSTIFEALQQWESDTVVVKRNDVNITQGKTNIMLFDADERARPESYRLNRRRPARAIVVDATPEIYVILSGVDVDNPGPELNLWVERIRRTIINDDAVNALVKDEEITFDEVATDLASGRQMQGSVGLGFTFPYVPDMSAISFPVETETEAPTEVVTETEASTEVVTETESEAPTEFITETESEPVTATETEASTEVVTETEASTEVVTETESEEPFTATDTDEPFTVTETESEPPPGAVPTFVAASSNESLTGTLSVPYPAGAQTGDIMILMVTTANESYSNPSGWTQIGSAGAAGSNPNLLRVLWKRYTAGDSQPVISGPFFAYARMAAFRGCIGSGSPIDDTCSYSNNGGTTAVASGNFDRLDATHGFEMAAWVYSWGEDSSSAVTTFAQPGAHWTNVLERFDAGTTSGSGGGIAMATAERETVLATGPNPSMNLSFSSNRQGNGFGFTLRSQ